MPREVRAPGTSGNRRLNDREIVTNLRAALAESLGQQSFELWFGAHTELAIDGCTLTVRVASDFFHDWLRRNFRAKIEACAAAVLGEGSAVQFVVDKALAKPHDAQQCSQVKDNGQADTEPESDRDATNAPLAIAVRENDRSAPERKRPSSRPSRSGSAQGVPATLAFHAAQVPGATAPARRRFARLADFVVGPSNRLAHTSAQMTVERPGELSPLMVYGPTGVGKTHLLEGIWSAAMQSRIPGGAVYLTAEQFTSFFLEALRGSGLPNFRRKYRGVGLLLIDDLQFFAGKRATLVELLYTVGTLGEAGRQIVLAADRAPSEMPELGDELVHRLEGGMLCRIEQPEYETRRGITAGIAGQMQLDVPADVLDFIAAHVTSHPRALQGALHRLHATSLAHGCPIDLPLAREALAESIQRAARPVRMADIERAVCQVFGLEPRSLQSTRKAKEVSYPRMFAMWLARKHTRAALTEIGTYFGRRSHATVLSAQQKVNDWVSSRASVDLADRTWNAEEAIRALEDRLRTG